MPDAPVTAPWVPEGPAPSLQPILSTAILAAAAGRYRESLDLVEVIDGFADPGAISAAAALRASILRQLHQHLRAEVADHRALTHAVGGASSDTRIDALAGLAADAIGDPGSALGRWAEVASALTAASPRARVRAGWVGAEVHLAAGQPEQALAWARTSDDLAAEVSMRHQAKSALVMGVCLAAVGRQGLGIADVRRAAFLAAQDRLRPLLWPSAYLLAWWLGPEAGDRWWGWARDIVRSIERDVPQDLRAGWRGDPAVAALLTGDRAIRDLR